MWFYKQPTEIIFGAGARKGLADAVGQYGAKPILVTDSGLRGGDHVDEALKMLGAEAGLFGEIEPEPTVQMVDALSEAIRSHGADVVVALGGGSAMDCAKAACSVAMQSGAAQLYHSGKEKLDSRHLPLVAMPTTAGTGSEVTSTVVLGDSETGRKAPLVHDNFYPRMAIVDPELTITMPRPVTASTGMDALSHAIEGYWSRNHRPVCDLMALEGMRLVLRHLPAALENGRDLKAREGMSLAALLGGLAFALPRTAAVHACSYPLSSRYHLPHGVACAMMLPHFIRFNAQEMGERGILLARAAGYPDMYALADAIAELKVEAGLPTNFREIGITEDDIDDLVRASFHPVMDNNPRIVMASDLREIYLKML